MGAMCSTYGCVGTKTDPTSVAETRITVPSLFLLFAECSSNLHHTKQRTLVAALHAPRCSIPHTTPHKLHQDHAMQERITHDDGDLERDKVCFLQSTPKSQRRHSNDTTCHLLQKFSTALQACNPKCFTLPVEQLLVIWSRIQRGRDFHVFFLLRKSSRLVREMQNMLMVTSIVDPLLLLRGSKS